MSRIMSTSGMSQVIEPEVPDSGYHYTRTPRHTEHIAIPSSPESEVVHDLVCIGFGPASLAIAIALQDAVPSLPQHPKVCFLERQSKFAWHSGMQLPGAKMQISFLKDLATPRNPKSKFTFINYLFSKGRLNTFINLDTFLPSRREYEDYLRWCASHFEALGQVTYSQEVLSVTPDNRSASSKIRQFRIISCNSLTGKTTTRLARHVVIAVGGKAKLPSEFPASNQVIHSSKYSTKVCSALPDPSAAYSIAVVGNGQSAAEIFNDLPSRYPNAQVTLIIKGSALRPSDDSPFVNEIFDPERVDGIFQQKAEVRHQAIVADRATNYGVVRLGLLEHLYERLYMQRVVGGEDPANWQVGIKTNRRVVGVTEVESGLEKDKKKMLALRLGVVTDEGVQKGTLNEEVIVDAVFVATGYVRNSHEDMLRETRNLLPAAFQSVEKKFPVARDYRVVFDDAKVAESSGIWLQGCNESTHGLSDTLLSILAVRGGELVNSIFGADFATETVLRAKL